MQHYRSTRKTFSSESGQAAVEFAMVLPLMLIVLLGVVDFGFAFTYWNDTQHFANSAARYAAVGRSPIAGQTIQAAVRQQADSKALRQGGTRQLPDPLKVCVHYPNGLVKGEPVEVKVYTRYTWMPLPYVGQIGTTRIGGKATMRLETTPDPAVAPEGCV
jgi:Flp pilus assembly protein TadG